MTARSVLAVFVAFAVSGVVAPTRANALERTYTGWSAGDFETNGALLPTGWRVNATTGGVRAAASRTIALSGQRSLQVDDNSPSGAAWALSPTIQVVGGSTYLFSAYSYAREGATPQSLTIRFHDSSGAVVSSKVLYSSDVAMMWSRVQAKMLAPKNAVRVTIRIASSPKGTGTVFWDAIDYFRPMFYNGQFENTPDNSKDVPWWTVHANGGSVTTTTDPRYVRTGNRALRIESSSTGSPEVISTEVSRGITYMPRVFPGITHDFTGWVLPVKGTPKLVVTWYDAKRTKISSSYSVVNNPKGEWAYYKAQIAAPLNAYYATLTLTSQPGVSLAYWDEMAITTTPPAPDPTYSSKEVSEPLQDAAATHSADFMMLNGRPVMFAGVSGYPARLEIVDVQSNKLIDAVDIPGAQNVFQATAAPNGDIYVGDQEGHLLRWRQGQGLTDLGKATPDAQSTMDLEIAPDGRVWGATTNKSEVYVYDPATNRFADAGSVSSKDTHARSLAITPEGVYVGTGPVTPKLVRIDPKTFAKTTIALPPQVATKFVMNLETRGNYLSVKGDYDSSSYRLYDWKNKKWVPLPTNAGGLQIDTQLPMPVSSTGEFYFTSYKQILGINAQNLTKTVRAEGTELKYAGRDIGLVKGTIAGLSGEWILHYDGKTQVQGIHVGTWTVKTWTVSFPPTAMRVQSIFAGPSGQIFTGGFGGARLGITNPSTGAVELHSGSSQTLAEIGEVHGGITNGAYTYLGTYTGGNIFRYDVSKPWVTGSNPKLIAQTKTSNQDRPYAWAISGQRTFFGTVPTYGHLGGSLGIIDSATATPRLVFPSKDRSVISLAAKGDVVFGGTSRWGGYGSTPTQKSATVFAYNAATNKKLWEITPEPNAQSVGGVAIAPNGNLWASIGWNLYEIGPNSGTVLRRLSLKPGSQPNRLTFKETGLQFVGPRLYTIVGDSMYSVDTTNLNVDFVADGITTAQSTEYKGRIYVGRGSKLYSITPSKATVPTVSKTPYRLDRCETANDFYVIPYEPGVSYYVDGERKFTGNYPTNGRTSVVVQAKPQSGWSLSGATKWTLSFTNQAC